MGEEYDLDRIERRAYLAYNEDGILDIMAGFYIAYMGLYILVDFDIPAFWIVLFGPIFWGGLKKAVTAPRIGQVKFGPGRRTRQQRTIMTVAVVVNVLLVLSFFVDASWIFAPWRSLGADYGVLIAGAGVVSLIIFMIGHFNEAPRFKGYAAISVALFTAGHFLTDPGLDVFQRMAYAMIPLGAVMMGYGIVTMWRFVRKHPKILDVGVDGGL